MGNKIKVVVVGACGKMGREVIKAVSRESDMELAGLVDIESGRHEFELAGGRTSLDVAPERDLDRVLGATSANVMVHFARAGTAYPHINLAMKRGVFPVVGTTGVSPEDVERTRELSKTYGVGAVIAPNFAIGAVLMMKFAEIAATYLPSVEVIELHHDAKVDAPSGTAIKTAEMIARSREHAAGGALRLERQEDLENPARGGEYSGIRIHSVRLPGLVAHQEIIFGGPGQTLTIRHDSLSRESFMPGVIMAIRKSREIKDVVYGLEGLLGL